MATTSTNTLPLRRLADGYGARMKGLLSVLGVVRRILSAILHRIWQPVLAVALLGWVWSWIAGGLADFTGDQSASYLWRRIATLTDASTTTVRLAVFFPLHVASAILLWTPYHQVRGWLTRVAPSWPARTPVAIRETTSVLTMLVLLALVVPLTLQPTIVPLRFDPSTWKARLANGLDGTAVNRWIDGTIVLVRRWQARPVPGMHSVTTAQLSDRSLDGALMARWDPVLREVTRDREHFAKTKAFLWVESAGRQYAVSTTGCAGLMQFCVSTAERRPFRKIFGVGQVSACNCRGRKCSVPRALRDALETDSLALERHPAKFPCSETDARFDGRKALTAGAAFTTELGEDVGGNLYLMYIGYNSGPAVAKRLWKAVGKDPNADLDAIRPHLAPILARWYGKRANGRAQGLLDVHLPKLRKAYEHYR